MADFFSFLFFLALPCFCWVSWLTSPLAFFVAGICSASLPTSPFLFLFLFFFFFFSATASPPLTAPFPLPSTATPFSLTPLFRFLCFLLPGRWPSFCSGVSIPSGCSSGAVESPSSLATGAAPFSRTAFLRFLRFLVSGRNPFFFRFSGSASCTGLLAVFSFLGFLQREHQKSRATHFTARSKAIPVAGSHKQAGAQERCRKHRHAVRMSVIPGGDLQPADMTANRAVGLQRHAEAGERSPVSQAEPPMAPSEAAEMLSVLSKACLCCTAPAQSPERNPENEEGPSSMAWLSVQSLLESFSSSVSWEYKKTALTTLVSVLPGALGANHSLFPHTCTKSYGCHSTMAPTVTAGCTRKPQSFPQVAQSQCFLSTRPWVIPLHSLYLLLKLTLILGQTLQYGAKRPVWGCALCNPSVPMSLSQWATCKHFPQNRTVLRSHRPGHPHTGTANPNH